MTAVTRNGTRKMNGIPRGAALNNTRNAKCVRPTQDQGGPNTASNGISFTNPNTITDTNNGLGFLYVGQIFTVDGSASNDRDFICLATGAGSITVEPSTQVTTEAAGVTMFIRAS